MGMRRRDPGHDTLLRPVHQCRSPSWRVSGDEAGLTSMKCGAASVLLSFLLVTPGQSQPAAEIAVVSGATYVRATRRSRVTGGDFRQ